MEQKRLKPSHANEKDLIAEARLHYQEGNGGLTPSAIRQTVRIIRSGFPLLQCLDQKDRKAHQQMS